MPTDTNLPDQQGQPPSSPKDPITCHVLDITTGLPAAAMSVKLTNLNPKTFYSYDLVNHHKPCFVAKTNADGRITQWDGEDDYPVKNLMRIYGDREEKTVWVLTFDTEGYFGEGKGFFPAVEVRFYVDNAKGSHVHVPLLIGPYSYTTYRGS